MAGIFDFTLKVNFPKLLKRLATVDGTGDESSFAGESADGKLKVEASGTFIVDEGVQGEVVFFEVFTPADASSGTFSGPAGLDAGGGGLFLDEALSGGVTVTAGVANDRLKGFGEGADRISGGGGNDLIDGGGGGDVLEGGAGADRIFGSGGDDVLRGGGGTTGLRAAAAATSSRARAAAT